MIATPFSNASMIVQHFQPSGVALDPARGEHRPFYKALRNAGCSVDWCEVIQGRYFFAYERRVDWVVANPPGQNFSRSSSAR